MVPLPGLNQESCSFQNLTDYLMDSLFLQVSLSFLRAYYNFLIFCLTEKINCLSFAEILFGVLHRSNEFSNGPELDSDDADLISGFKKESC